MALPFQGGGRVPSPLGTLSGGFDQWTPGPAGNTLWDKQTVQPAPSNAAHVTKKTKMPKAADHDQYLHLFLPPLFASKDPAPGDVQQGSLANCAAAAILAACAFTDVGRQIIRRIISEIPAPADTVLTDLSAASGSLQSTPPSAWVLSSRYFTVNLKAGSFDVSDWLYTNSDDNDPTPTYMHDPRNQSIWAAMIEKALALSLGESYNNCDDQNLKANDHWEKIIGVRPDGRRITADTSLNDIVEAARKSTSAPTIAASKEDSTQHGVTPFHGHAIVGMEGPKIKIYDPAPAKTFLISPAFFRDDFTHIFYPA